MIEDVPCVRFDKVASCYLAMSLWLSRGLGRKGAQIRCYHIRYRYFLNNASQLGRSRVMLLHKSS